jgi:hypothetical protein
MSEPGNEQRSLTELEFVELAARRAFQRTSFHVLLVLAEELMTADVSQLDGGSDTRAWELNRLRRIQT